MPATTERLGVGRIFSREDFAKLCFGMVPRAMEDKWFVFFESPWLYVHRSWTGACIYRVRFERLGAGVRIAEAIANRDSLQYGERDPARDTERMLHLLASIAQRNWRYGNVRSMDDFANMPGDEER